MKTITFDDVKCVKHIVADFWMCNFFPSLLQGKYVCVCVFFSHSFIFLNIFWSDEFQLLFSFKRFFVHFFPPLLLLCIFARAQIKWNTRWSISNISDEQCNDKRKLSCWHSWAAYLVWLFFNSLFSLNFPCCGFFFVRWLAGDCQIRNSYLF